MILMLVPALTLALFVICLYYPLLFTNRVLASGDILLYVYPYRDYAAAVLRSGQLPLWNPYIFLGVPFLANPQAAVLYPLHWPLIWLPVAKQVYWSAAIHTWLLGFGGWMLLRRWGLSKTAALVSGLILAGSGFYGGMIGHLNQMNAAAWLPWGFWILDSRFWILDLGAGAQDVRQRVRLGIHYGVLFALVVALMLLAGHTQTAYINLFAMGIWVLWRTVAAWRRAGFAPGNGAWRPATPLLILIVGTLLGVLLSAAQLWPTLELSALGLRSGGLSYAEATSFSLKPLDLLWTLLPSYGLISLEAVFATPAYTEFVAYVGLIGLVLSLLGAWNARGGVRTFGLLFAFLGLFLALGRWNPVYFLLYTIIPGFDLFRTPARWMMLYTLGMAVLAGVGVEWVMEKGWEFWRLRGLRRLAWDGAPTPAEISPIAQSLQSPKFNPPWLTLGIILIIAIAAELWLAARALPYTSPTAPQAVSDVRTAPAHLLTDPQRAVAGPAAMGRFLGMSTITYDPGDMADWRRILLESSPPQLDQQTFDQLIIALKVQELLVPNLSLLWRVPAVDGFDGGVLPLQRYNEFLTLFIPREELVPDGRLREQLRSVPSTDLLNLVHGQYLITDKVRDLWFEHLFYDRQIGARLHPGLETVTVATPRPFAATHIDLIAYIDGPAEALATLAAGNQAVASVTVAGESGPVDFTLEAGGQPGADLADGRLDSPLAATGGALVAYRDVEGGRQEYRVRLPLPTPLSPQAVRITRLPTPFDVVVQAVTLFDQRTGMFDPLLPSDRGRFALVHSGDVKIYENLDLLPRTHLVHQVIGVEDAAAALALLHNGAIDPGRTAVVEGMRSFTSTADADDFATIIAYAPEWVEIRTRTHERALLVLSDTAYPGWVATVDGAETPIYTTNGLFRGIEVPAGEHTVIFAFRPASWQYGWWVSTVALLLCSILWWQFQWFVASPLP
jgi:hypothetical protein